MSLYSCVFMCLTAFSVFCTSLTFCLCVCLFVFTGCRRRQRNWPWLSRICRRRRRWPTTSTPKSRRVSRAQRGRASESEESQETRRIFLQSINQSINLSLSVCLSPSPAASCCSVRNSLSSSFITPSNHCAAQRPASPPRKPCWTPRWPLLPPRPHPRLPLRCRTRTTLALLDPL